MPDFCQTMSSLEPVLKAYEGPDTLFLYNINAHSWVSAVAILIAITRVPGGARRSRTDDILLAKQALSQLSYGPITETSSRNWWARVDSNYRPHAYQACALTT